MQHCLLSAFLIWGSICPAFASPENPLLRITFKKLPCCPANASLSLLSRMEGAYDERTCLVDCAINPNCSVVHSTNRTCYFGNATQLATLFNQSTTPANLDSSVSHVKLTGLTAKLIVFFDFRLGFSNLVSPGIYDASPRGSVTRGAQGAHFFGNSNSFIEVDTMGGSLITDYLDHPQKFSFFARVVRQAQYQQTYHYFYDCLSPAAFSGRFGDRDGRAWIQHPFPSQSISHEATETRQSNSAPFLKNNNILQVASVGAVFHGKSLNNFYLNGSFIQIDPESPWGSVPPPRCLRLGYDSDINNLLKGRIICYAIARDALSAAEFQQLDQMCS